MEYWYDARHTGALRVLDPGRGRIYGGDPNEPVWTASVRRLDEATLEVDFEAKRTHHGKRVMIARYKERRNQLHWPDGNVWLRLRVDPRIVLSNT